MLQLKTEVYIPDICGESWWAALEGVVNAINCPTCREGGVMLLSGMHDLINHSLGKEIYDPPNFNDVANYYTSALKDLIDAQEKTAAPAAMGQHSHVYTEISEVPRDQLQQAMADMPSMFQDLDLDASVPVLELEDMFDPPGLAMIKKFGRTYTFTRTYRDDSPPDVTTGLTRAEAYKMLEDALEQDAGVFSQDFRQEISDTRELELDALADFKLPAFDAVTTRIVEAMDRGVVPWRRPWSEITVPRNAVSDRPYSGINPFLLGLAGYDDPRWLTYKQAQRLGGNIKRGEKGTTIIFWKILRKATTIEDEETGEETVIGRNVPLLRHYTVFNAEQTEGIPEVSLPELDLEPHIDRVQAIEAAEAIVTGYDNPPRINHEGGDSAFYRRDTDTIALPPRGSFLDSEWFYGTLFHEMTHSTGHKKRLDRLENGARFGDPVYAREELVAEFGAAFLMQDASLDNHIENEASYIKGWTNAIKDDPKMIVIAATRGEKAARWILGVNADEATVSDPALEPALAMRQWILAAAGDRGPGDLRRAVELARMIFDPKELEKMGIEEDEELAEVLREVLEAEGVGV